MAEAMPAFFRNANELGILDPVGAYRSNMDARRAPNLLCLPLADWLSHV